MHPKAESSSAFLVLGFSLRICAVLFLKDIQDYFEARRLAALAAEKGESNESPVAQGYKKLEDGDEEEGEPDAILEIEAKPAPQSSAELAKQLTRVVDRAEELEVRVRVHRKSQADWVSALRQELKDLQERREQLKVLLGTSDAKAKKEEEEAPKGDSSFVKGGGAPGEPEIKYGADGKQIRVKKKKPPPPPPGAGAGKEAATALQKILKGPFMGLVMRTITGVMAISLYFMDIISDVQVIQLLWGSQNWLWCWLSILLLVLQFLVVWLRVIPYLASTFGTDSGIYLSWLWGGFPMGVRAYTLNSSRSFFLLRRLHTEIPHMPHCLPSLPSPTLTLMRSLCPITTLRARRLRSLDLCRVCSCSSSTASCSSSPLDCSLFSPSRHG